MNIMLLLCYVYEALFSWCTSVSKACFVFYWLWAGSFSQRIKISNPIGVTGLLLFFIYYFIYVLDILHPAGAKIITILTQIYTDLITELIYLLYAYWHYQEILFLF